jgi:SAM-dependent methyltransferase
LPPTDGGRADRIGAAPVISTRWQLARDAAVRYQDVIVPGILGPFASALVEVLAPRTGEAILDVGCGTGAATRILAEAVGRTGRVVGLDLNPGMLAVARGIDQADAAVAADGGVAAPAARRAPIEWIEATALEMPLPDRSFDAVVAAQVLQFVSEIGTVAAEMRRVLRPGGRMAASVWRGLDRNPYFAAEDAAVRGRLGDDAADALSAGFHVTDPASLTAALTDAGFEDVTARTLDLALDLPPLADWAPRHLAATPVASALAGGAAPGIARELGADIAHALDDYVTADGVRVLFASWIVEGRVAG